MRPIVPRERERVTFTFTKDSLPYDLSTADKVVLIRRSNQGDVDSYATDDPSPIVSIDGVDTNILYLDPPNNDFWPYNITFFLVWFDIYYDGTPYTVAPNGTGVPLKIKMARDYDIVSA